MKTHKLYPFLFIALVAIPVLPAQAQVQIGGLADFELRKGGSDSSPYVNQTPNGNLSLYTPYIRLFISGDISENWFISSALQADYYGGEALSPLFFSVVNINWLPVNDSDFMIKAGRFVTPYGAYSKRVLSSDNPFVHLPLTHSSGLPISKKQGFLYDDVDYGNETKGLNMVYQRMYTQGIMFSNQVGESGWLSYNLAATLNSASSHFEYGQYNKPAFTGRINFQPFVWGSIGLSLSHGAYMLPDSVNAAIEREDLADFNQTLAGVDILISYHYYTFLAEYNRSKWQAPYYNNSGAVQYNNWKNEANIEHVSLEFVLDFSFLPGSYGGIRLEKLISGDLTSYEQGGWVDETWTYDRERIEVTAGLKLQRNIVFKASYLYSGDNGPALDDNVFTLQLSAGF